MGCALNSTHVIYFSLFYFFYFLVLFCCISESLGLGWPDLLLWKSRLFTISQTQFASQKAALSGKYVLSAEVCRDSGQLQVIDLLTWVMCGL